MLFKLINGFVLMTNVLLLLFGLLSKKFFIVTAKVAEHEGDVVVDGAEVLRDGAPVHEEVEGGQEFLELTVEPLELTDFHRRTGEAEEGKKCEEDGGHFNGFEFGNGR